jgi:hypothetical protein
MGKRPRRLAAGRSTTALAALALGLGAPPAGAAGLALERVLLSTGGVGYLDWAATVGPEAELALVVPRSQADDILKSLTVYDSAGLVGTVTLAGETPLADLFRDLPIGQRELARPVELLQALKGARLEVEGPRSLAGRVLAVTPEEVAVGDNKLLRHRVTLASEQGLRSFLLEEAGTVRLAEPAMAGLLETALDRLAAAREPGQRRVVVRLAGAGERRVRVGYLIEAPLWKPSYRVVLGEGGARLQAWAVVDNRSGVDWPGVELTLVAGSPVTLRQALASTYFVDRPEIPIRLFEGVRPRVDRGAVAADARTAPEGAPAEGERRAARSAAPAAAGVAMMAPPSPPLRSEPPPAELEAATAAEAASQTLFRVARPVSLAQGASALVPLADRTLPAERVALLQPDRHPTRPLAAVRIVNDGPSTLPPGIVTLLELDPEGRASFLGDAELALLPAGESRLVPYAIDGKTRVLAEPSAGGRVVAFKVADGILLLDRVERQITRYRVEAPAGEARTLVIEHPKQPGFRLAAPAAAAETDRHWRIERRIEAGGRLELEVVSERPERREVALLDLDPEELRLLFAGANLPEAVERAMAEIGRIRARIGDAEAEAGRLERERRELETEQARLRSNLQAVPRDGDLARRYLGRLAQSEDRLEALAKGLAAARAAAEAGRAELSTFVRRLAI